MLFKKKIYPEAYIKLFLETAYPRCKEQNQFVEKGFSKDEIAIINDTTYYVSLIFVFYSLRINFWDKEKQLYTFFQAFEMVLKQKGFDDRYVDQECGAVFELVKEFELYLETQKKDTDIGLNLYMFCNDKIDNFYKTKCREDENFISKSSLIASYTKTILKQIPSINDIILNSFSLRKD